GHLFPFRIEREAEEEQDLGEEVSRLKVRELLLKHRELALLELLGGEVQRPGKRRRVLFEYAEAQVALHALGCHSLGGTGQALTGDRGQVGKVIRARRSANLERRVDLHEDELPLAGLTSRKPRRVPSGSGAREVVENDVPGLGKRLHELR